MLATALEHLIKGIVDHPDDAAVTLHTSRNGDVLDVHVHPEDFGRVVGRSGRTAKALRTVINALADGKKVRVNVVDTDF